MKCKDNTTIHIRQSSELNEQQRGIYDALDMKYNAGEVRQTEM